MNIDSLEIKRNVIAKGHQTVQLNVGNETIWITVKDDLIDKIVNEYLDANEIEHMLRVSKDNKP